MAKVSIIIPFYNPGKYFKDCLNSVSNQSLDDIEVICVDDGSTDGSLEYISSEFSSDSRFKIISQANNGAGVARNKAIDIATGEFILFLDADDWIERDACEKLYYRAKILDVDLILFDSLWHHKHKTNRVSYFSKEEFKEDSQLFTFNYNYIRDKMMRGILGVIWNKFYKTSFIKEKNIRFPSYLIYNDIEFHFKTILLADSINYYPEVFYHYIYTNEDSIQNSLSDTEYEMLWIDVINSIANFLKEYGLFNSFKKEFLNYFLLYSRNKFNSISNQYKETFFVKLKYFFESLSISVDDLKLIDTVNFVFYIHIINAEDFPSFIQIQNNFSGDTI